MFNAKKREIEEHILAISWKIATEPKLYRELSPNPYSIHAAQIIAGRFPGVSTADIIKAVVLAEPEGRYDRYFRELSKEQQEEELPKQKDKAVEIHKRLVAYDKKNAEELRRLPKEFAYSSLSIIVFETTDVQEIEKKYPQDQRLDFKLAIVRFIDDTRKDKKSVLTRPLLQVGFAILSLVLIFYVGQRRFLSIPQYSQDKQTIVVEPQKERQAFPIRLKIPSITVDAAIQNVGLTTKGAMEVPNNDIDVGWFKLGARPGEKGSAVIAGHLDGENNKTGVFTNLYKLKEGDKAYIENSNGTSVAFVVREKHIYDSGYAEKVFSLNDGIHLNLITCYGVWDGTQKSYTKRLVVFADLDG